MRITTLAAVAALVLAACGAASDPEAAPSTAMTTATTSPVTTTTALSGPDGDAAFPAHVEGTNGTVVISDAPMRIVSLSPTATEMLFAVGAGDQVVAVDEYSYYPAEAPVTDLSGYTPNLEAIVGYEPDLVVVSDDIDGIVEALETVDVTVLQLAAASTFADVVDQIGTVGVATGHEEEAAVLSSALQDRVDAVVAQGSGSSVSTYYHELDPSFYSFTSTTFIGEMYGLLGLTSIADPADDGAGYPQLSAEYILEADPDLIVIDDCCGETAQTIAERPGWSALSAVGNGAVVKVDADEASRWGPRIVDFLETIAAAVARLDDERA